MLHTCYVLSDPTSLWSEIQCPSSISPKLAAGLGTGSNQFMQGEMAPQEQQDLLLQYTDQLRLSMAANLQDYQMESCKASITCVMNNLHHVENIGLLVQIRLGGFFCGRWKSCMVLQYLWLLGSGDPWQTLAEMRGHTQTVVT